MTYQVLARKWRPGTFNDLVGQTHVLKPLTHALDNERLHHAYLFTGTRGVGKTTLARILARCLNCEQGVSSTPCGTCNACTEITEGRFIDLIEVDAASRTKVEDTRELLENVQYSPSRGRFKIYLIDEVHMLSTHSFNALLKTLEEPPPHVKFLLATTDPQKLPVTILSRCLQFNLKNLSPQQIADYLKEILDRETIDAEEAALWQLANAAAGSMRDALTLLDQAISFCEGTVSAAGVSDMLGTPEQGVLWQLLDNLATRDAAALLETIQQVAERAPDFQQLLDALLAVLHRLAIAQLLPRSIDNSYGDREQVQQFAERFSPEDLQLCYQFALKGRADLSLAPDSRAMFEMLMIRMLVFSPEGVPTMPQTAGTPSPSRTAGSGLGPAGDRALKPTLEVEPEQKKKPADPGLSRALQGEDKAPAGGVTAVDAAGEPVARPAGTRRKGINESTEKGYAVAATALPQTLTGLDNMNWPGLYQHLNPGGITGNLMAHCVVDSVSENQLSLCLERTQSAVFSEDHQARIQQLLADYFQCPLALTIAIGEPACESPAARNQRLKRERLEQLRNSFEQDDNVRKLVETFSAQVLTDSISPLGS